MTNWYDDHLWLMTDKLWLLITDAYAADAAVAADDQMSRWADVDDVNDDWR